MPGRDLTVDGDVPVDNSRGVTTLTPPWEEDISTPDVRIVDVPPPRMRMRPTSDKVVTVHPNTDGSFVVKVSHYEGEFEKHVANEHEVRIYLEGVDAGSFPEALVLPEGWK